MTETIISKICTKCKIEKPLFEFHKELKDNKIHQEWCKRCANKAKSKAWYHNHKDDKDVKASREVYRLANVEFKAEYDKQYREDNEEKLKVIANKWKANNIEKVRDIKSNWKLRNVDLVKQSSIDYQAKRRLWLDKDCDSTSDILEWVRSAEKVCHWCNCDCEDNYHQDHFMPLSKGGSHTVSNLVISCPTCNLRKNAKHPDAFRAELDRELEELKQ